MRYAIIYLALAIMAASCNQGPKVIETGSTVSEQESTHSTGIFGENPGSSQTSATSGGSLAEDLHEVTVLEVLPTDKYVYLRVEEKDKDGDYWIATRKQEVREGGVYFYRGGLLKTQFESKEYNRVFDKVYLVSNIVPANHGGQNASQGASTGALEGNNQRQATPVVSTVSEEARNASISIAELVKKMKEYEGRDVQLTGVVSKVNPNIMGRNWIHLKDGSKDDYDLVLTSSVAIPEGHEVSLKGKVTLDRDFGAGYTYELLIENAELVR